MFQNSEKCGSSQWVVEKLTGLPKLELVGQQVASLQSAGRGRAGCTHGRVGGNAMGHSCLGACRGDGNAGAGRRRPGTRAGKNPSGHGFYAKSTMRRLSSGQSCKPPGTMPSGWVAWGSCPSDGFPCPRQTHRAAAQTAGEPLLQRGSGALYWESLTLCSL